MRANESKGIARVMLYMKFKEYKYVGYEILIDDIGINN